MLSFKLDSLASDLHESECYSLYSDLDGDFRYYNGSKIMAKIDRTNKTVELLHNHLPEDLVYMCHELLSIESESLDVVGYKIINRGN